jgi:hypothetical protein
MGLAETAFNLKWFFSELLDKPLGRLKKLWAKKIARTLVICFAAAALVVPLITIITVKTVSNIQSKKTTADIVFKPDIIAGEDMFIPDEPDFLPPVMLEQEQKQVWTSADASEFWTGASKFPAEFWRSRISASIDRLLEPLP